MKMPGCTSPVHSPATAPATLMIEKQTIRSVWVSAKRGANRLSGMLTISKASRPEIGGTMSEKIADVSALLTAQVTGRHIKNPRRTA